MSLTRKVLFPSTELVGSWKLTIGLIYFHRDLFCMTKHTLKILSGRCLKRFMKSWSMLLTEETHIHAGRGSKHWKSVSRHSYKTRQHVYSMYTYNSSTHSDTHKLILQCLCNIDLCITVANAIHDPNTSPSFSNQKELWALHFFFPLNLHALPARWAHETFFSSWDVCECDWDTPSRFILPRTVLWGLTPCNSLKNCRNQFLQTCQWVFIWRVTLVVRRVWWS